MQIAAGISIPCAMCIIAETYASHRAGTGTSATRILFCQMIWTVFYLFTLMFGRLPMPAESGAWGAAGNTASCTAQGFFVNLGAWAFLIWDIALSITYVFMVCYGWTETQLRQRIEKVTHAIGIIVPILFALAGLFTNSYNPGYAVCTLAKLPYTCDGDEVPCERGEYATLLLFAGLLMSVIALLVSTTSMIKLYCFVRHQEVRNRRYGASSLKASTTNNSHAPNMSITTPSSQTRDKKKITKTQRVSRRIAIQGILYSGTYFIVAIPQNIIWTIRATSDQDGNSVALGVVYVIQALYGVMYLGIFTRRQQEMRTRYGQFVKRLISCGPLFSLWARLRQEHQQSGDDRQSTCQEQSKDEDMINDNSPESIHSFADEEPEPVVEPEA
ncbi:expressed unknown protein [Seminavis robusta]|uniref:G-protein coupled receptors family 2 profile 2 domain-containing protein n=1 Tax=Seminavis robusta TaxID=568900 RepID=A0A9N8H4U8_9STRA|nr:expressed unknown protein [Seminavis robusta]|eukprot:Sro13_g010080.1 n/a (386) ;mRNA; f:116404-117561